MFQKKCLIFFLQKLKKLFITKTKLIKEEQNKEKKRGWIDIFKMY